MLEHSEVVPAVRRLARWEQGYWSLTVYERAGEAGGAFVAAGVRRRSNGIRGAAADPDRARAEAARRAGGKVRRYCAANRLSRLGTLTYGPPRCTDPLLVRAHVGEFFRALRTGLGDRPLPYVWVPELPKDGVHFHVHFAVGQYVKRALIERAWGRGFVHIKLLSDLPVGSTSWQESRRAARYVSKYVTKSVDRQDRAGLHRYDVAEGFQPRGVQLRGTSPQDVIDQARSVMGGAPAYSWSSSEALGWQGPPALWLSWDR